MKKIRLLIFLFIILGVILFSFAFWANRELHQPISHAQSDQYIEIARGTNSDDIINNLTELGVIRRGWLLRMYVRLTGASSRLKAGEYRFPTPISSLGVIHKLEEGQQRLSHLTIVEGWTRWDIAALLVHIPELKLKDTDEAIMLMNDTSLIRDIAPEAQNLEGYLFPDTYSFPPDTTPQEVIATMVRRFLQVWNEQQQNKSGNPGKLTPNQIVTIASLIETEAKLAEERPLVASVIKNRLQRNMPLGIDSTLIYAAKLAGKWKNNGKVYQSDLERDSPYNTRKLKGLPPGPIASPGARSIDAALNPAQTDYLFYVREPTQNNGTHNFYNSESDFQHGVQALREWERQRDASRRTNSSTNSLESTPSQ